MDKIIAYLGMAVVVEAVVSIITEVAEENSISWKKVASIIGGILFAVSYGMDILTLAGFESKLPLMGEIVTGLMLSRGSNYIYQIWAKMTKPTPNDAQFYLDKNFRE